MSASARLAAMFVWVKRLRVVYFAPLLLLGALGAWVLASPIGAAPDDNYHLASVWCATGSDDLCQDAAAPDQRIVDPAVGDVPCYASHPDFSAKCHADFLALDSRAPLTTGSGSFTGNYPPVFYKTMSVFASPDVVSSALAMRWFNVLLFVGLGVALWCLLPLRLRPTMVWGWAISVVPLGMFIIASNNPSSWAVTGLGTSWLALLGFFETSGKRRVMLGILYGVATLMAAGSRADAAIYAIVVAVAVGVLTFRATREWLLLGILPAAFMTVGLYFYLSSGQSSVASTGLGVEQTDAPLSFFGLLAYNLLSIPDLWAGVFGSWPLGWFDTVLPAIVPVGALAAFVAVGFMGIAVLSRRKALAAAVVLAALLVIPIYVLMRAMNHVGQNVQPRYLLPLVVVLAGILVLSVANRQVTLTRPQLVLAIGTLSVANAVALHVNIRRYVTGTLTQGVNLDSGREWWWSGLSISPMAVWVVGSVAFALLLTSTLWAWRERAPIVDGGEPVKALG